GMRIEPVDHELLRWEALVNRQQIEVRHAQLAPALIKLNVHELVFVIRPEGLEERKGDDRKATAMRLHQVAEFLEPLLLLTPDRAAIGREHQLEILLQVGVPREA